MADLLFLVGRDVIVVNNEKRISTGHTFGAWLWSYPNALEETPQLICIGVIPCCFVAVVQT